MPYEFQDYPPEPATQTASRRGGGPPSKRTGADLLDPPEAPAVPWRWHISVGAGIVLLVIALLAIFLTGLLLR